MDEFTDAAGAARLGMDAHLRRSLPARGLRPMSRHDVAGRNSRRRASLLRRRYDPEEQPGTP